MPSPTASPPFPSAKSSGASPPPPPSSAELCYSSQSKGFFSKAIAQGTDGLNEKIRARFLTPENLEKLEKVKALCAAQPLSPAAAVLLYLTHNQFPAAAIIGCSSVEQLRDSLSGRDFILTATLFSIIPPKKGPPGLSQPGGPFCTFP